MHMLLNCGGSMLACYCDILGVCGRNQLLCVVQCVVNSIWECCCLGISRIRSVRLIPAQRLSGFPVRMSGHHMCYVKTARS